MKPTNRREALICDICEDKKQSMQPVSREEYWLLEQLKNGGGGGATCWDDLEGKPFYENVEISPYLENLELSLYSGPSGGGAIPYYYSSVDSEPAAIMRAIPVGQTLLIVWDGEEYDCAKEKASDSNVVIGNRRKINPSYGGPVTYPDCPICISFDSKGYVYVYADTGGAHTLSIYAKNADKKTLEYKYLPDELVCGRKFDVVENVAVEGIPSEFTVEEPVAPETVSSAEISHLLGYNVLSPYVGGTVVIVFDGEEYECTPISINDPSMPSAVGNFELWSSRGYEGSNPDAPFCLYCGNYVFRLYVREGGTHTISVLVPTVRTAYETIPEGVLPESVESVILRSSTEGSTKKFKLTVDDSGELNIAEV